MSIQIQNHQEALHGDVWPYLWLMNGLENLAEDTARQSDYA